MANYQIHHQVEEQRFVLTLDQQSSEAVLEYRLETAKKAPSVDFYRTYLPFSLRGKGLAEPLVEAGLQWARSQGLEIKASCWFVEKQLA